MNYVEGNNITDTFYDLLKLLRTNGVHPGPEVLEVSPVLIRIRKPMERCLVIPHRLNNGIQSIAETLWVLGGRDDLEYLAKYLPRANQFSDDGKTWRGAYGKRICSWFGGVNQIKEVVNLLREDKYSTRGVMILFDPSQDISLRHKDVPCNNWIQFSIRDNKLNMHVAVRANDLIWGFSGINFFEWSILQEMLANWLNIEIGEYYHFTGFLAVYKRHYERCKLMEDNKLKKDIYKYAIKKVPVDIKEQIFEEEMHKFFSIEATFRNLNNKKVQVCLKAIEELNSEFLKHCLRIMLAYNLHTQNMFVEFNQVFELIQEDDLKIMVATYFARKSNGNLKENLQKLLNKYDLNF